VAAHRGRCGFPAGLERTIVVDLTGKLPAGAHRIRLVTNLEIYWDQVLIDNQAEAESRTDRSPLSLGHAAFPRLPKQIEGAQQRRSRLRLRPRQPHRSFQHQRGNYTRFGDVTPLRQAASTTATPSSAAAKRSPPNSTRKAARAARALEARLLFSTPTAT
jgi:hypothetical protein